MRTVRADRWLAALVAVAALLPAAAADFGTLFTTPEERARLDRLRRGEATSVVPGAVAGPREVTGFVKRSDGRSTVWIDGVPIQLATPRAGALLEPNVVRGYADPRETLRIERSKGK